MLNRRELLQNAKWLIGGAIVAPTMVTLLQSCKDEPRLNYQPKYFSQEEADFVAAYVDTLLPRTSTPGGLDVKVDVFIDKLMAATSSKKDAPSDLQKGIKAMNDEAQSLHGQSFAELDQQKRAEIFTLAEKRSPKYNPQVWGKTVGDEPQIDFYRSFKSLVIWAYLSSEKIGEEVLNYDPIPGEYKGDIALSSVGGKAWSL